MVACPCDPRIEELETGYLRPAGQIVWLDQWPLGSGRDLVFQSKVENDRRIIWHHCLASTCTYTHVHAHLYTCAQTHTHTPTFAMKLIVCLNKQPVFSSRFRGWQFWQLELGQPGQFSWSQLAHWGIFYHSSGWSPFSCIWLLISGLHK